MAITLAMLRMVVLVAALSLAGRWVVGLFAGRRREENFVYRLFSLIARPPQRVVRWLLPRSIPERWVPTLAWMVALIAYLGLGLWERDVCLRDLSQAGCQNWAAARAAAPH